MPQHKTYPHDHVVEKLGSHGIQPVREIPDYIVIWGLHEIGKEFPVRFISAMQIEPGRWDLWTIRNLLFEFEIEEEHCRECEDAITGYVPAYPEAKG